MPEIRAGSDERFQAVETSAGRIDGDIAVLATGAWSKPLMAKLGITGPLETERGYHIVFKGAEGGPRHPVMVASGKFVATPMAEGRRCAGILEFGGLRPVGPKRHLISCAAKPKRPSLMWFGKTKSNGKAIARSHRIRCR